VADIETGYEPENYNIIIQIAERSFTGRLWCRNNMKDVLRRGSVRVPARKCFVFFLNWV
jgi:hypothetical protein